MITEKTKVARNNPSVTRVTLERMKIRTALGEYWLAASWMATSVVANTTATNASVAAAMAAAKVAALSGH
jgi:tryptophan synthase beta subunit